MLIITLRDLFGCLFPVPYSRLQSPGGRTGGASHRKPRIGAEPASLKVGLMKAGDQPNEGPFQMELCSNPHPPGNSGSTASVRRPRLCQMIYFTEGHGRRGATLFQSIGPHSGGVARPRGELNTEHRSSESAGKFKRLGEQKVAAPLYWLHR